MCSILKHKETLQELGIEVENDIAESEWETLSFATAQKALQTMPQKAAVIYTLINILNKAKKVDAISHEQRNILIDFGFAKKIEEEETQPSSLRKSTRDTKTVLLNKDILKNILLNENHLTKLLKNSKDEQK